MSAEPRPSKEDPNVGGQQISLSSVRWSIVVAVVAAGAVLVAVYLSLISSVIAVGAGGAVLLFVIVLASFSVRSAQSRIQAEQARLQQVWQVRRAELQEIAGRDDLTKLQNRRFFYERLKEEMDTAKRTKKPLSILMIDVDDLKAINDEFGHQVGDVVLRSFGHILNATASEDNVTARLGGDEFAVIMPSTDRRGADQLAWKIWEELSKAPICETEHASIYLGVSVGTGGYPWGGSDLEEIIHWADTKLYANKLERKGFKHANNGHRDTRLVSAVVDVLSSALDIRDRMTHRHARRVARMAACVAREMRLSEEDVLHIEYAAALHDIGKIGVADDILRKAEPLDADEWRDMRRHSELGYQILNGIDFLREAAEIVFSHHEKFDGTGYPRGLTGTEIPLGARVFAVVDAFDAMTSRRPYREAMPREDALTEIRDNAGTQFDPDVVDVFLVMVSNSPDGFRDVEEDFGTRYQEAAPIAPSGAHAETTFVPTER